MLAVSSLVSLAARSCENLITESTETFERLLSQLWPTPSTGDPDGGDEPWWATPGGSDDRFVDALSWSPTPAGPWGPC